MELRQLRTFVAVAEELHFHRAAQRLYIAQPSVSQQIKALESELGVKLFERDRRSVSLTPAGTVLLDEARELLARAEHALALVRAAGEGARGRLRLSLTRSLTGGIAGAIVNAYRERYPEVDLELAVGNTMMHVQQLHAGNIDAGFVRPPLEDPLLEELPLGREPLVCVLPKGHRLARRSTVRREDLYDEPLVWWPVEHGPGAWHDVRRDVYGEPPWPPIARVEPEEERIVSAVAEGAGRQPDHVRALALAAHPRRGLPPLRATRADDGDRAGVAARRARSHARPAARAGGGDRQGARDRAGRVT